MKERYYNLCRDLFTARGQKIDNLLAFDAIHETRRKEQLIKLWNRTEEEVKENVFLSHFLYFFYQFFF